VSSSAMTRAQISETAFFMFAYPFRKPGRFEKPGLPIVTALVLTVWGKNMSGISENFKQRAKMEIIS
jgi:hypothetical protein